MSDEIKAVSLDEQASMVRRAFDQMQRAALPVTVTNEMYCLPYWVVEVYPDHIIVCENIGDYTSIVYTLTADGVQFAAKDTWQHVEKDWIEAKGLQTELVVFGGDVKALGGGKVGGFLVQYTNAADPDASNKRDFFNLKSDLDIEDGERLSVYYDHGLDSTLKNRKIGKGIVEYKDAGLWFEAQLDLRDEYEQYIYKMVEGGKLGWSTGPAQHLVRREKVGKSNHITHWPIKEASLTPAPAEYRNAAVALKSLPVSDLREALKTLPTSEVEPEHKPETQAEDGQPLASAATSTGANVAEVKITVSPSTGEVLAEIANSNLSNGENNMTDANQNQTDPRLDQFDGQLKGLTDRMDKIVNALDKLPMSQNPGYVTGDGGAADKNIKSFGDYLVAVRRNDVKRLETVYEVKALQEDQGGLGGYLVPDEYMPRLLEVAAQNSQIVAQLETIPVTSPKGKIPSLDMFFTPTAGVGQTAFAGGINPASIAEGGAYSSSDPNFELVEWSINKVGFKTTVSNELMSDSPISMETLLTRLAGIAIGAKTEYYVLRGVGAGVPLGILNAPATVSYSAANTNTFAYADASGMIARHLATSNKVFWLMHKSTIPDVTRFEVGTGGAVWMANVSAGLGNMPLLGYPIIFSEHLPKADSAGHVILADLAAYLLFVKGNITVAYSEHADFGNGNVVWRFDRRLDGQPWMKAAVTDANPGGSYTTSPFVQFNN